MLTISKKTYFPSRAAFLAHAKTSNKTFIDSNPHRVMIEYIRDNELNSTFNSLLDAILDGNENVKRPKGHPNAVMVAYKRDNGEITFGWSAVNPKSRDRFDKTIGLWKAIRRVKGEGRNSEAMPIRVDAEAGKFMLRAHTELK